jgi:hypothetical protein
MAQDHVLTKQQPSSEGGLVLVMSGSATLIGGQAYGWLPGWVGVLSPHVAATAYNQGSRQGGCGECSTAYMWFTTRCSKVAALQGQLWTMSMPVRLSVKEVTGGSCQTLDNC